MLKQIKKTLSILLVVCILMPVTAAAASAHGGGWGQNGVATLGWVIAIPTSVPLMQLHI